MYGNPFVSALTNESNAYDDDSSHYGTTGRVVKTARTGAASTLFQQNVLGQMIRSGLDVDDKGTLDLASNHRITDTATHLGSYGGSWWMRTDTVQNPLAGDSTPFTTATARNRFSGFAGNRIMETQSIDATGAPLFP